MTSFAYEDWCDDLGPKHVAHLYEPRSGLRAVVVVDNVACGPAIGGVRMAPDVDTEEVFRLARATGWSGETWSHSSRIRAMMTSE